NAETDPHVIELLVSSTGSMPRLQQRRVLELVKKATGIPMADLKAAACDSTDRPGGPDQLALAKAVAERIGMDNVFSAESAVWYWKEGVWRKQDDRTVKQM